VIVTARYLSSRDRDPTAYGAPANYGEGDGGIKQCLKTLSRNTSAVDFRVTLNINEWFGSHFQETVDRIFPTRETWSRGLRTAAKNPIFHEYILIDLPEYSRPILEEAYCTWSVVHFVAREHPERYIYELPC
jgi:hypothetical protein